MIAPPTVPHPPLPRADALVDPRVGDAGPALLALEDGTVFPGIAFGAPVSAGGDLVVNTSQTGYQEIATDPSYAGQVVVMTYPLIGNYGRLRDDDQSARPWLRGLVVAHATAAVLDDARQLATMLRGAGIPAIAGVDTRALARHLRANGCLRGVITGTRRVRPRGRRRRWPAPSRAGRTRTSWPRSRRRPSATSATTRTSRSSRSSTTASRRTSSTRCGGAACGSASCRTRRRRRDVLAADVRGVVFSPGPGDPARLDGAGRARPRRSSTTAARCSASASGHQIVARAAGAETTRLRFGHHGANHPVQDLDTGYVQVTAQNHEVQVVGGSLPASSGFRVSQLNLNDRSVEGLRHADRPIETVQYHPEGAPGPLDALAVFDRFVAACRRGA